jgi:hypothetical protein
MISYYSRKMGKNVTQIELLCCLLRLERNKVGNDDGARLLPVRSATAHDLLFFSEQVGKRGP